MRLLFAAMVVVSPVLSFAATFSTNNGAGSSTIGTAPGSDYPSLAAAAGDFNSFENGMTGNYTFYFTSDLNEPTDVAFGNGTNGFTLTFKPAPGVTPTITFTSTESTGYLSKWVFGANAINNNTTSTYRPGMPNIVIDGSNTPGGASRDLTITNTADDIISTAYAAVLMMVGDCDNAVVKNCKIHQIGAAYPNPRNCASLIFLSRTLNSPQVRLMLDFPTVENCEIRAEGSADSMGIICRTMATSGVTDTTNPTTGTVIRGCDIEAQSTGIHFANNAQALVEDCTFRIRQTNVSTNFGATAINHSNAKSAINWTITIRRNQIKSLYSASTNSANALMAFQLNPESSSTGFTYRIENNMIGGFEFSDMANSGSRYNAFYSNAANGTIELLHNSINMPHFSRISGSTGRAAVIALDASASNMKVIAHNNIIRFLQSNSNAALYYASNNPPATYPPDWDYNDIVTAAPTFARLTNAISFTSMADWQASGSTGRDNHSFSIDPFLTPQSHWTSDSDLHFTPDNTRPLGLLPVPYDGTVPLDADKETRSAAAGQNYPGADYLTAAPLPVALSGFTLE